MSDAKLKKDELGDDDLPDAIFDESTSRPDDFDRTALPPMVGDTESEELYGETTDDGQS